MATRGTDVHLYTNTDKTGLVKRSRTRQRPFWLGGVLVGLAEISPFYSRPSAP